MIVSPCITSWRRLVGAGAVRTASVVFTITFIGGSSYDYGNTITFMILGFGFDYWWTDKFEVIEDDDDNI